MEQAEWEGHYKRLKQELATAYLSPVWDSRHIDRLAHELLAIERIAGSSRGGARVLMRSQSDGRSACAESCPGQLRRPPRQLRY